MRWVALFAFAVGCGGEDGGENGGTPSSFGGHDLASLDESCEGVAGVTGQALLAQKFEQLSAKLGYVTASGDKVSPTDVSITLVGPASPVATCYPAYSDSTVTAEPRLGSKRACSRAASRWRSGHCRHDESRVSEGGPRGVDTPEPAC